jgi:hypothetical protein
MYTLSSMTWLMIANKVDFNSQEKGDANSSDDSE